MNRLKITIVTVCYNADKDIEATMLSVLNQTYENIEYLLVDGASRDNTLSIINQVVARFPYRNIKVKSEPDKGIYYAMNKGIEMATGEWINFMNVGDTFASNEVLSEVFDGKMDDNCSVIYGRGYCIYPFGKHLSRPKTPLVFNQILPFIHQSAFVKTQVMQNMGFDVKYKVLADLDFFKKLFEEGHVFKKVDSIISNYEIGGFSERNQIISFYENEAIQGNQRSMSYYFRFIRLIVRLMISIILPKTIIDRIRKIKYATINVL